MKHRPITLLHGNKLTARTTMRTDCKSKIISYYGDTMNFSLTSCFCVCSTRNDAPLSRLNIKKLIVVRLWPSILPCQENHATRFSGLPRNIVNNWCDIRMSFLALVFKIDGLKTRNKTGNNLEKQISRTHRLTGSNRT